MSVEPGGTGGHPYDEEEDESRPATGRGLADLDAAPSPGPGALDGSTPGPRTRPKASHPARPVAGRPDAALDRRPRSRASDRGVGGPRRLRRRALLARDLLPLRGAGRLAHPLSDDPFLRPRRVGRTAPADRFGAHGHRAARAGARRAHSD